MKNIVFGFVLLALILFSFSFSLEAEDLRNDVGKIYCAEIVSDAYEAPASNMEIAKEKSFALFLIDKNGQFTLIEVVTVYDVQNETDLNRCPNNNGINTRRGSAKNKFVI